MRYIVNIIVNDDEYPEIEEFKTEKEALEAIEEHKVAGFECFLRKKVSHDDRCRP